MRGGVAYRRLKSSLSGTDDLLHLLDEFVELQAIWHSTTSDTEVPMTGAMGLVNANGIKSHGKDWIF
jgi:hypothetical protein